MMAFRLARPAHLIDMNAVAGLNGLAVRDGALRVGAGVRHADFHRPVSDGTLGFMLATVVQHIAHYPIRLRGTFCGSLAHADPAAEWCVIAATLDAELVAVSVNGERLITAATSSAVLWRPHWNPKNCSAKRAFRFCPTTLV